MGKTCVLTLFLIAIPSSHAVLISFTLDSYFLSLFLTLLDFSSRYLILPFKDREKKRDEDVDNVSQSGHDKRKMDQMGM